MKTFKRIQGRLIISGMVLLMSVSTTFAAEPVITAKKAAEINGTVITMMTLNNEYRQILKQQGVEEENIPEESAAELKKEILESLINQELLYQECRKNNISADEKSVSESFASVKSGFENEKAYENALKDANMKEEDLVNRIRRSMAINVLVTDQITQHIAVTAEESRAYYDSHPESFERTEKVRASHILVMVAEDAGEAKKVAAREKLVEIQKKLNGGEDFAELAKEYSDCPSGENGGDLGYFERGKMVQEFENAAFAMKTGEVSDIVTTQYGFHLIKVTDKIEPGTVAYETVKSDLEEFMKQKMISSGVASLIETIKKNAEITTYL